MRNMAASFNPTNDRLLGPKTYQGAKAGVSNAYDDSYADNLYDAPIESTRETGEFGHSDQ